MSKLRLAMAASLALAVSLARTVSAQNTVEVTFDQALGRAARLAPDLAVARAREAAAHAEVGVAGIYPNPSAYVGTTSKTARLTAGVVLPLYLLGQRGAAMEASRAELQTVRVESAITLNEVRTACARAFVALWLAQRTAEARAEAAAIARKLDASVQGRVEVGNAPELEGFRATAERLRADADAQEAQQAVGAAGAELARWIAVSMREAVLTRGDPPAPIQAASLDQLIDRAADSPAARREDADARAAEARASRERALVRPSLSLDLGMETSDPTLPGSNYHAILGVDLPLFNQRGPLIDREIANAGAARARAVSTRVRISSEVASALSMFTAAVARRKALAEGVVPAAEKAAVATEESYALGRAPLVAVLDAERARIEARLALLDAHAAHSLAWVDLQSATGWP